MICIARIFGAPTRVPAGNVRREQVERVAARLQPPVHAATMCITWL